jgi:DNA-binding transcriptional LysR family regulator
MRYFVAVADDGQLTRAARRLNIAQPALSHVIAQLEAQLGTELFERHARGVRLTPAGEAFLEKARIAVAATDAAEQAARSHATTRRGVIDFGFLGVAPALDSPGPFEDFARVYPGIEIRFRELPFPYEPTRAWLADVDVAVCHTPPAESDLWIHELRRETRVVLAPRRHPLSECSELGVDDVLDETFIGLHPSIARSWAGFWSLDDHRGAPPRLLTADHASNPQEVFAALAVRCAITTVPASVGRSIANLPTGLAVIPLRDADPSTIALIGDEARSNPRVDALRAYAENGVGDHPGAIDDVNP